MKKIITILLLILSINFFAQEGIGSFKNDLKTNISSIKDVITISNVKNNDVAVFIADAKNVYGYKLNENFEVTSKITSEEKRRKYKTLLGYSIPSDDNYKVVLSNKNENKFLIVDFHFSEKNASTKEFVLDSPYEKVVQTLSINNEFYLITAVPFNKYQKSDGTLLNENQINFNDDFVNFYRIKKDNSLSKKNINLSQFKFISNGGKRKKVRSLLLPQFDGKIPKIDISVQNPIDITAKTSKLYFNENEAIFTFDKNKKLTQVLRINLLDFTPKKDLFDKKLPKAKRSNSFLHDNNIIIASANKKDLTIEVLDFKTKEVIKEFSINEKEEITFKNSPIVQKGGVYANYRELKTSKQFLRKITADKFGVTISKINDKYELSIGGYSPKPSGGGMMMPGFGGIPIAGFGAVSVFFNPVMFAYNASSQTKSTQIDCLLDANFNHISGNIPESTFDKIDNFLTGDRNEINEVFKINDQTIMGSYNKVSKIYFFTKF